MRLRETKHFLTPLLRIGRIFSPAAAPDTKLLEEWGELAAETANGASGEEEGDKECMVASSIAQEDGCMRLIMREGGAV